MKITDRANPHVTVFGTKRSGKTNWVKWFLKDRPNHVIVDPVREFPTEHYNVYRPESTRGSDAVNELDMVLDKLDYNNLDWLAIDESNRYVRKGGQLVGPVGDLVDMNRHKGGGLGIIFVARRPSQIHTDVRELSDYVLAFNLAGRQDLKALDKMAEGGSKAMNQIGQFEAVMFDPSRNFKVMKKVEDMSQF